MDTRKRGVCSVPAKKEEYTTKRELTERNERRSYPQCPPLPSKVTRKKTSQKTLFPERPSPKAVFFSKPVSLSRLFNPDKELTYFEQIFARNDKIGEGSFGEVYKVRSREDDKIYAIKQLKSTHNLKYGYAEVQNYEKVGEHGNCVKLIMAWEELKVIHIQMEYCQMSLAQYSGLAHNIEESQLWEILYDMLRALDHLHKKNLIHLDVKPGNIMMSKGFYKLADFGLLVDLNKHDGRKISTISDGDAKYLACEVLDGNYTYACDIFGLGISLLELATNIVLPEYGPLWHQIRKDNLPLSFYNVVTSQFAVTIEKMMALAHWQRPAADKMLKHPSLKKVQRKDKKVPRNNYGLNVADDQPQSYYANDDDNNENNIVETPRRPLYEVRNGFRSHGSNNMRELRMDSDSPKTPEEPCRKLQENNSPEVSTARKGLSRVKLAF